MTSTPPTLDALGDDPASVLVIVNHFDRLEGSAPERLIAAATHLTGCPVDVQWTDGQPAVSINRDGPAHPLDAVVVDRLRRALRPVDPLHLADPALVEVVISAKEQPADRGRAIRLLGLDEARDLVVLAVSTHMPRETLRLVESVLPGRYSSATIGHTIAVLCQGVAETRALTEVLEQTIAAAHPAPMATGADRGPWIGIGCSVGVFAASESWRQALRALRFASSTGYGRRAIAYERLSVLELLADLAPEQVLANRDIARINEIAATPSGAVEVGAVEAFCVFGSLRRTAEELHVHHSTVAARLAHVAEQMGWDFDDPMDRFMATLVLMVRRISLSAAALAEADSP